MQTGDEALKVFANRRLVGQLVKEDQQYVFQYAADAQEDGFISLTMPVRTRSYQDLSLLPIFEMHLPEGYLLSVLQRHFSKLIGSDELDLLKLLAPNIHGRLTYQLAESKKPSLELKDLLHPKEKLFEELVERFALHSAVSGVQPKVLAQVQDKATLQTESYIVKTWGNDYPQLALNEYWCMKVVAAANVTVPEFYLSDDARFFIMRRFDVYDQYIFGFEDGCVLQGKSRKQKYEGSYEQLAKTLQRFISPQHKVTAMQQYFKIIVLNHALQNGDGHLKNFGILYNTANDIWLAPAYDIVSTTAYIKNDTPALTVSGSRRWMSRKRLLEFGQQHCQLTNQQASHLYDECEEAMQQTAVILKKEWRKTKTDEARHVLSHLHKLMTEDS